MKKIFLVLFIVILFSNTYANKITLSSEQQLQLKNMKLKIDRNINKGGIEYLETAQKNLITNYEQSNNNLIPYLLEYIQQQIKLYENSDNNEYEDWIEKDNNNQQILNTNNLRNLRLKRVNEERVKRGINELKIESKLNWTASIWSEYMMEKVEMTHKRLISDNYYNTESIKKWFKEKNIIFKTTNKTMFCENIGVSPFRCFDGNCEDSVIQGLRQGFQMMMVEQYEDYKEHYLTIINGNFKIIGFGLSVDYDKGLVFYTAHYGTELE